MRSLVSHFPWLMIVPLWIVQLCACTAQRIEQDIHQAVQWVRLSTGSSVEADNRWQFSRGLQIALAELLPGDSQNWLGAARNGMSQVFPAARLDDSVTARREDLLLLIRWPGPAKMDETTAFDDPLPSKFRFRLLPVENFLPKYAETLDIRIFVIDSATDQLIQSATLDISPWWFSSDRARSTQIERAFRMYAESLVTSR